jgi:hypothetical protein
MIAVPLTVFNSADSFLHPVLPVTLKSLLSCLGGVKPLELIDEKYRNSLVSFTHFIKITEKPRSFSDINGSLLQQMFCRSSAIVLPDNTNGADILIPTVVSDQLTWIVVQVKTREYSKKPLEDRKISDSALLKIQNSMLNFSSNLNCSVPPVFLIMYLTFDTSPATLSVFEMEYFGEKAPCILLEGSKFLFKASVNPDESNIKSPFSFSDDVINRLNSVINDLSKVYRGAKLRQTTDFAFFSRDSVQRFNP